MGRLSSSQPLMASVGPLEVPGRSKYASTSAARSFRVRPSRRSSEGRGGQIVRDGVDRFLHELLAGGSVGMPVGGNDALVDAPDPFDLGMLWGLKRASSLVRRRSVRNPSPVCKVRRARQRESPVVLEARGCAAGHAAGPDRGDTVKPCRIACQDPFALGKNRGVRRVPRHPKTGGDTRHRQVIDDDAFQRPPHPATGNFRPWFGRHGHRLPPRPPAPAAPIPAHPHHRRRRPLPERHVKQPSDHGIPWDAFCTTPLTPVMASDDTTR